ncbi:MAG: hypothetical protein KDD65_06915 [Bacteroidetes bacterium]|nr:hypothetical protein [Bacteroidota bacterium]
MNETPSNTYELCYSWGDVQPWNPFADDQEINVNTPYFSGVFRSMEQHLNAAPLKFYVTWNVRSLPSYGDDVVAVVLGDEWCRIPDYANRVRAVFKCYGFKPATGARLFRTPSHLNFLAWMQYLRMQAYRTPGVAKSMASRLSGSGRTPLYPIPLGYANQMALPIRPLQERGVDIYFAGSVDHTAYPMWSAKKWLQTPKSLARQEMLAALKVIEQQRPDLNVKVETQAGFTPHRIRSTESSLEQEKRRYSEAMMDTIVCPVPRGTSLETFRYFEGMRYGCIVITEALPPHWFYNGSPTLRVERWSELGAMIDGLLADPERMNTMHTAALEWWDRYCSEAAVGKFIADKLRDTGL